mmetsp:Transcript_25359/g.78973  ORF Transcript_25359/g.78973 Transcript_25359/m.78973 type:complete len:225 (+) Transcript_25359:384-1058(+)
MPEPKHRTAPPGRRRDLAEELHRPGLLHHRKGPHEQERQACKQCLLCTQQAQENSTVLKQLKNTRLRPGGGQTHGEGERAVLGQGRAGVRDRRAEQAERVEAADSPQQLLGDEVRQQQHPENPPQGVDPIPGLGRTRHRPLLERRVATDIVRPAEVAAGEVEDPEERKVRGLGRPLQQAEHGQEDGDSWQHGVQCEYQGCRDAHEVGEVLLHPHCRHDPHRLGR